VPGNSPTASPRSPRNQHPARRIRYSATAAPNPVRACRCRAALSVDGTAHSAGTGRTPLAVLCCFRRPRGLVWLIPFGPPLPRAACIAGRRFFPGGGEHSCSGRRSPQHRGAGRLVEGSSTADALSSPGCYPGPVLHNSASLRRSASLLWSTNATYHSPRSRNPAPRIRYRHA